MDKEDQKPTVEEQINAAFDDEPIPGFDDHGNQTPPPPSPDDKTSPPPPPPNKEGNPPPPPPGPDTPPPPANQEIEMVRSGAVNMLSTLKKRVDNDQYKYEIPTFATEWKKEDGTEMNSDEIFDAVRQEIYKFTDFGDDEFIEAYRTAKAEPNFKREDFLKKYNDQNNFLTLSDDEKLFTTYKAQAQGKMTDQELRDYISSMPKIDKITRATAITEAYQKEMVVSNEKRKAEETKTREARLVQIRATDQAKLAPVLAKMSTLDNIGGLKFGEQERKDFEGTFRDLYDVNPETGYRRYEELFDDPETLYTALYFVTAAKKGAVKDFLTKFKEEYKEKVINSLDLGQRAEDGGRVPKKRYSSLDDSQDD